MVALSMLIGVLESADRSTSIMGRDGPMTIRAGGAGQSPSRWQGSSRADRQTGHIQADRQTGGAGIDGGDRRGVSGAGGMGQAGQADGISSPILTACAHPEAEDIRSPRTTGAGPEAGPAQVVAHGDTDSHSAHARRTGVEQAQPELQQVNEGRLSRADSCERTAVAGDPIPRIAHGTRFLSEFSPSRQELEALSSALDRLSHQWDLTGPRSGALWQRFNQFTTQFYYFREKNISDEKKADIKAEFEPIKATESDQVVGLWEKRRDWADPPGKTGSGFTEMPYISKLRHQVEGLGRREHPGRTQEYDLWMRDEAERRMIESYRDAIQQMSKFYGIELTVPRKSGGILYNPDDYAERGTQ